MLTRLNKLSSFLDGAKQSGSLVSLADRIAELEKLFEENDMGSIHKELELGVFFHGPEHHIKILEEERW